MKEIKIEFPLIYDENCIFYSEFALFDKEKYFYDEIAHIIYSANSETINGFTIKKSIEFSLMFMDNNYMPYPMSENELSGFISLNYVKSFNSKKHHAQILEMMYFYLQKMTFNRRLRLHLNTLEKYDKFSFFNDLPTFYNNGDLYEENKCLGNLKQMYDNNKIIDGSKFGGGRYKKTNPFVYGFIKDKSFFGLLNDTVQFNNTINRDVMYILFDNLYKNGKMNKF